MVAGNSGPLDCIWHGDSEPIHRVTHRAKLIVSECKFSL